MTPSLLDATFAGLLLLTIGVRRFVPDRRLGTYGALVSLALLAAVSLPTLVALGGISTLYVYPLALVIGRLAAGEASKSRARIAMRFGIGGLVALMVAFKVYSQWGIEPSAATDAPANPILQIVGLSYFLFRAINYLYMQVLSREGAGKLPDLVFYLLFPTTLTSGPIQKYLEFRRELAHPRPLDRANLGTAIYRITQGYFYKVCLSYVLLAVVHRLLASANIRAWESAATTASLYLYFFFDFAGYCHIAIGAGLLLGIKVPENFRQPFLATSITEFWRNWHITLPDWFRDHVFIPLGGMRASRLKASALAFVIMVLVGLWHGLTWACLIWGAWHGLLLFAEGVAGVKPLPPVERKGWPLLRRALWTNARVAVGELLFLASPGIGTWHDFWRVAEGFLRWR